jgi:hypothetical protein
MTAAAVANFAQLEPGFGSEVGILLKHGDCERDFIDDARAGAVPTGKQFEVPQRVVAPVSVNVMDGFLGEKLSPDVLLHDEAVLENRVLLSGDAGRDRHAPVAIPLLVAGEAFAFGNGLSELSGAVLDAVGVHTFLAAKALRSVVDHTPVALKFLHGMLFPAMLAGEHIPAFRRRAKARAHALCRAVLRVFPVLVSVGSDIPWAKGDYRPANLARDFNTRYAADGPTVDAFVFPKARHAAEFARVVFGLHRELLGAILAVFNNRHVAHLYKYEMSVAGIIP